MPRDKIKQHKAWFSSRLELPEIGEKFISVGVITEFDFDCENVYEWFVGCCQNTQFELNVSRKHCDGEGFELEPIHVMVMFSGDEPPDAFVDEIASSICDAFKTKVYVGQIDYLDGDEFKYRESSVFGS